MKLSLIITIGLISILLIGCATTNIDTSDLTKEQYREVKSVQVPEEQTSTEPATSERRVSAENDIETDTEGMMEEENMDAAYPTATIQTSKGDIVIELDPDAAPKTVANFMIYANEGFYDGTVFHRVIDGFMIQGGGFTPDGNRKDTHDPIALESQNGLLNKRGTIAMARTNVPDSATSQFFINVVDNAMLDYRPGNDGYAVFGKVVSGMDVVDAIKGVSTGTKNGMGDWPVEDVVIEKVSVDK